jgi:hypothetical protein
MQPGYPPSGQDPYGQQQSNQSGDPQYSMPDQNNPQYGQPPQSGPPQYNDPAPSPFAPDYSQPGTFEQPPGPSQPPQSYQTEPQYPQSQSYEQPSSYTQPQYADPYAQPVSGAQAFPVSGPNPYPVSGGSYGQPQPPAYHAYPPVGYQVPGYGLGPNPTSANALGIVSLVLGILSIPLACCSFFGLVAPIPAIICGILGIRKANQGQANNKGLAIAGLICGIVGLIISLSFVTLTLVGAIADNSVYY